MKFKNGRNLLLGTRQAIRFATKTGFLRRTTWYELFASGSLRWKQDQIARLVKQQIFKKHHYFNNVFMLGRVGQKMVLKNNWHYVISHQPSQIIHDETIAKGLFRLEQNLICPKWMLHLELKRIRDQSFKLGEKEKMPIYPDAVFKLQGKNFSCVVAVEYEDEKRTHFKYNKLLQSYSKSHHAFSLILIITKEQSIERCLKKGLNLLATADLKAKVGFIPSHEWIKNPLTVRISYLNNNVNHGANLKEVSAKEVFL